MFVNAEIHQDLAPAAYHAWNAGKERGDSDWRVSRSELMDVLECGEMFLEGGRYKDSISLTLGDLVDVLLLTPEAFDDRFSVHPESYQTGGEEKKWNARTKYCREWQKENPDKEPPQTYITEAVVKKWTKQSDTCKQWIEEQEANGKTVISPKMHSDAKRITERMRRKAVNGVELEQLIDSCDRQTVVTADWRTEDGQAIPCRCMLDMARIREPFVAYDLKTAQDVSRPKFKVSMIAYGYDVQSWMYSEMLAAALKTENVPFGFIAIRNTHPFLVATYRAKECLEWGEKRFREGMSRYADALRYGFEGYTESFEDI